VPDQRGVFRLELLLSLADRVRLLPFHKPAAEAAARVPIQGMRTETLVHSENASNRSLNRPDRVISGAGRSSNEPVHAAVSPIAPENR
jgi:hypothetical protein